jgi:hypothetical protein
LNMTNLHNIKENIKHHTYQNLLKMIAKDPHMHLGSQLDLSEESNKKECQFMNTAKCPHDDIEVSINIMPSDHKIEHLTTTIQKLSHCNEILQTKLNDKKNAANNITTYSLLFKNYDNASVQKFLNIILRTFNIYNFQNEVIEFLLSKNIINTGVHWESVYSFNPTQDAIDKGYLKSNILINSVYTRVTSKGMAKFSKLIIEYLISTGKL